MKCPVCNEEITDRVAAAHFRFEHSFTTDDVIEVIFTEIYKLNDRIVNLCKLLQVKEK
jgi:hypothetical protein